MAKILIVDDYESIRDLLSILLTKAGYKVECASSKKELNSRLSFFKPNLILLDVKLNGEDGREICKFIKSQPVTKEVAVILLSASPNLLWDYVASKADDIIEKPFNIKSILQKINKLVPPCAADLPQSPAKINHSF